MTNRVFWLVAALLTVILAVVLFASDLNFWMTGIIFVAYGAAIGFVHYVMRTRGAARN